MKIVFSRKGFDGGSGGVASPIVNGVPVSIAIPGGPSEPYRYRDLQHPLVGPIAPLVERITKGRITARHWAHADPVLPLAPGQAVLGQAVLGQAVLGQAVLGQTGTAQAHLENQGVGAGDVFVFFGLFRDYDAPKGDPGSACRNHPDSRPHHRIFGMMTVERVAHIGADPGKGSWRDHGLLAPHPHTERAGQSDRNTLWIGRGMLARTASPILRLTVPEGPTSLWSVPEWLLRSGLSYHGAQDRWSDGRLSLVGRGQEFVADPGDDPEAKRWLRIIEAGLGEVGPGEVGLG